MSARKPVATAGAKADNNNTSLTVEVDVAQRDDAAAAAAAVATGGDTSIAAAARTEDAAEAEQDTDKDQCSESRTPDRSDEPSPLITECGTPRRTYSEALAAKSVRFTRHSSPLQLLNSSPTSKREARDTTDSGLTPIGSDSDELPSGSSSNQKGTVQLQRSRKSIKELKEAKEAAAKPAEELLIKGEESGDAIDMLEQEAANEPKETKDIKDNVNANVKGSDRDKEKDTKDCKEKDKEKESTPTPTTTAAATASNTCNRVTRKAHAQELALANNNNNSNTRVTRNRRQSSTGKNEPSLPARGRRKRPAPPEPKEQHPVLKRKRSDDDAELALKCVKHDIKVEDDEQVAADEAKGTVTIKLEPLDAEEPSAQRPQSPAATPAAAPTPTATTQSGNRRGRGRPQTKNTPVTSAASTRATRNSKAGSPGLLPVGGRANTPTSTHAEPVPPKRRRVGSANRSLGAAKAASVSSSSLAASTTSGAAGDEDSKDSVASISMDEHLLAVEDIKQEKIVNDFEETLDVKSMETESEVAASTSAAAANGIEPLTVDIEPAAEDSRQKPEKEASKVEGETEAEAEPIEDGKAPSLSPELISEGVSAISVKQFYKKPEFLANNLGIEKDPELGEIVQIASEKSETPTATTVVAEASTADEQPVPADPSALELEPDTELEDKLNESSTTIMDELRIDESDDTDIETQKVEPIAEPEAAVETATEAKSLPSELNGEAKEVELPVKAANEIDDYESEIMEQLAKEGVLDASGNALSASKHNQEQDKEHLMASNEECDTTLDPESESESEMESLPESSKKKLREMGVVLEVEPMTEEQEAEVNAVADADTDMQCLTVEGCGEYPEENKENVSTATTDAIAVAAPVSPESVMDMELALKVEAGNKVEQEQLSELDEEKSLAAVAAEQKPQLPKAESNGKLKLSLDNDDELRREKERHLQHLGLLTHQAAEQVRQEFIHTHTRAVHPHPQQQQHQQSGKRSTGKGGSASHVESSGTLKTVIKLNRNSNGGAGGATGVPTGTVVHGAAICPVGGIATSGTTASGSSGSGSGSGNMSSATRKGGIAGNVSSSAHGVRRQSLKMTFQKGRARGHGATDRAADQHGAHAEDSYYTIQNEVS